MVERGEREGLSTEDRKEMATLRREAKRMTMESDLLKRSATFRGGGAGPVFTERGRIRTTIQSEGAPPLWELVGQRFAPRAPDVTWCGDISYFPTGEGWLYPAGVLDLGSRRLLGWVWAKPCRPPWCPVRCPRPPTNEVARSPASSSTAKRFAISVGPVPETL
jgi:transposase InsO family protein